MNWASLGASVAPAPPPEGGAELLVLPASLPQDKHIVMEEDRRVLSRREGPRLFPRPKTPKRRGNGGPGHLNGVETEAQDT